MSELVNDDKYYELYKYINDNSLTNSDYLKNPSVQFFDVMAHHYKKDIIGNKVWVLPDLRNWSCAEVAYALNNIGQAYKVEFVEDVNFDPNAIVEQSPQCGEKVSKSRIITLKVNSYNAPDNIYWHTSVSYNLFSEIGEWIYYIYNGCIYRSRVDGTESTIIYRNPYEDYYIVSLVGKTNEIYCILISKDMPRDSLLVQLNLDNCTSNLITEVSICFQSSIYGNYLYLLTPEKHRYNIDTGELTIIDDYPQNFIMAGDYIYFVDEETTDDNIHLYDMDQYIVRRNLQDSTEEILFTQEVGTITNFAVVGNDLYIIVKTIDERNQYSEYLIISDLLSNDATQKLTMTEQAEQFEKYYLNIWRDKLLLLSMSGDSFLYDMGIDEEIKISTFNILSFEDEEQYDVVSYSEICGNYLCYHYIPDDNLNIGESEILPFRYNLITGEKEEFILGS
jgi:PASTA domain.